MASVSAAISGAGHPAQHDGHQPGRHLIIGNVAAGICGNELLDFFAGEFARVSLAADQINGAHAVCEINPQLLREKRQMRPEAVPGV